MPPCDAICILAFSLCITRLDELASRNLQYDLIHMDLTKGNYAPTFDKIHQLNLLTKDGALLLENST